MTIAMRTSNQQQRSAPTDSLLFEAPFAYNAYASSSKTSSPTSIYGPLSHPSSYIGREGRVQDPYRVIADDARRLRRARQQQQAARQQHSGRRSFDYGATVDYENDDDDEADLSEAEDEFDEHFSTAAATVSMRRLGSNDSQRPHRPRTVSGGSATSSIAFAAAPPSPRPSYSSSPSTVSSPLPHWPPTPAGTQYALPSSYYDTLEDDPSSPFTQPASLLMEDDEYISENESGRASSITKPIKSTRRGVIRLAALATRSRDHSDSKRRPSLDSGLASPIMSSPTSTSIRSVDSLPDTAETPSCIDAARRQWELLSLRVSLRVFHTKQHIATGLHRRNSSHSQHSLPVV